MFLPRLAIQRSGLLAPRPLVRQRASQNARHSIKEQYSVGRLQQRTFIAGFRDRFVQGGGFRQISMVKVVAVIAFVTSAFTITAVGTTVYRYYQFLEKCMNKFPEPVGNELRKAIFYRKQGDAKLAVEKYRRALELAAETNMFALSDEIISLKCELAEYLGENGRQDKEMEIFWSVWNELIRAAQVFEGVEQQRIAKRAVFVGLKLGALLSQSGMRKREEEVLTSSVELMLRHSMETAPSVPVVKDSKEGDAEDEDTPDYFFTKEEMGAALESLGHFYESTDKPALATPLFLRALTLCEPKSCHAVNLMSNLSGTLAVHPADEGHPREELLVNAIQWADKALEIDNTIKPPTRTIECDEACVSATFNLGAIAEIRGKKAEALKRYKEAKSLSEALNFTDSTHKIDKAIAKITSI